MLYIPKPATSNMTPITELSMTARILNAAFNCSFAFTQSSDL